MCFPEICLHTGWIHTGKCGRKCKLLHIQYSIQPTRRVILCPCAAYNVVYLAACHFMYLCSLLYYVPVQPTMLCPCAASLSIVCSLTCYAFVQPTIFCTCAASVPVQPSLPCSGSVQPAILCICSPHHVMELCSLPCYVPLQPLCLLCAANHIV
jgi:hypothetical protein